MSYRTQSGLLGGEGRNGLEWQTRKAMRTLENKGIESLAGIWKHTKHKLAGAIMAIYHQDFGSNPWTHSEASAKGTFLRIDREIKNILAAAKQNLILEADRHFQNAAEEEKMRSAWMLDQATPPNIKVKIPTAAGHIETRQQESDRREQEKKPKAAWYHRLNSWVDVYGAALASNITLGALNGSTISDAADEVEETKAGSPAMDMLGAIGRIFTNRFLDVCHDQRGFVAAANPESVEKEIWQTLYDDKVCDICSNDLGLTRDEVPVPYPAHPNDRCFYRTVPKPWADLLRAGGGKYADIAKEMDRRGLVPDSIVVGDAEGNLVSRATIPFDVWKTQNSQALTIGVK